MEKTTGMDLVVSFDTTGSMYPVLSKVRQNVSDFVNDMFASIEDLRVGVIAHGDYCDAGDPYTIRIMDFTTNKDDICKFIRTTEKTYGGDADECYELVLNNARTTMSWQAGRIKVFVLIGDASPHSPTYGDNKQHLDWRNEAGLLNDLGVKIFAVHALSFYRNSSRNFYETIAHATNGKYLTLDQFDEVVDLIRATCMAEYSEEMLNEFVSIIKSTGRMTKTMARNIGRLNGKHYDTEAWGVQKDGLVPVTPGRFQVMTVTENCPIKEFVESNGIEFKRGRGFYELTKHETVQQYKEVIIQDRTTGEMFTGMQVRVRLGLQPQIKKGGVHESLSSRDTAEYRVFVQSTSFNRKLIAGTSFLYEVSDLSDVGTAISSEDGPVAVARSTDKVKATTKKKPLAVAVKSEETTEVKAEEAALVAKKPAKLKAKAVKDKPVTVKEVKKAEEVKKEEHKKAEEVKKTKEIEKVEPKKSVKKVEDKVKYPTTRTAKTYTNSIKDKLDKLESLIKDKEDMGEIKRVADELTETCMHYSNYINKY